MNIIYVTKEQLSTLVFLSARHTSPLHLYGQIGDDYLTVEFEFPYRYIIERDGSYRCKNG